MLDGRGHSTFRAAQMAGSARESALCFGVRCVRDDGTWRFERGRAATWSSSNGFVDMIGTELQFESRYTEEGRRSHRINTSTAHTLL